MNNERGGRVSPEQVLDKSNLFLKKAKEDFNRAKSILEKINSKSLSVEDKEAAKSLFVNVRKSLQAIDYWTHSYGDDSNFKALLNEAQSLAGEIKILEEEFGFNWEEFQEDLVKNNDRTDFVRFDEESGLALNGSDLILEQINDYDPDSPEFEEKIEKVFKGLRLERDALLIGIKKLTKEAGEGFIDTSLFDSLRDRGVALGDYISATRVGLNRYPNKNESRISRLDAFINESDTLEMYGLLKEFYDNHISSEEEKIDFKTWHKKFVEDRRKLAQDLGESDSSSKYESLKKRVDDLRESLSEARGVFLDQKDDLFDRLEKLIVSLENKLSKIAPEEVEKEQEELVKLLDVIDKKFSKTNDINSSDFFDPRALYAGTSSSYLDHSNYLFSEFTSIVGPDLEVSSSGRRSLVAINTRYDEAMSRMKIRVEETVSRIFNSEVEAARTTPLKDLETELLNITIGVSDHSSRMIEISDNIRQAKADVALISDQKVNDHFSEIITKAEERLESIGESQLEYWLSRVEIEDSSDLNNIAVFTNLYDLLNKPVSTDEISLETSISDMNAAWAAIWDIGSNRIIALPSQINDSAGNNIFPTQAAIDEYQGHSVIVEMKRRVESHQEKMTEDLEKITLKTRVKKEIEDKWKLIMSTFKTTSAQTQNDRRVNEPWDGNIESTGILALVEKFFPDEKEKWNLNIKLWNAFVGGAGRDPFKQLGWEDAYKARAAWRQEADFDDLRAYSEFSSVNPAFKRMVEIFEGPQEYEGTKGVIVSHDYAKDGNPGKEQIDKGVKTVAELIKDDFKDLDDSSISSLMFVALMGELRLKYHAKYHGGYLKSADGTFHTKALLVHSPLDYGGYKLRAYGKIFPELRLLFQILRWPGKEGIYQEDVTKRNKKDRMPIGKTDVDEYLPLNVDTEDPPGGADKIDKYHKDSWKRATKNNQVMDAIQVRTALDRLLTSSHEDFTPVQLEEDMVVVPYYWDLCFNYKEMGIRPVTAAEYNSTCEFWLKFLEQAQNPSPINEMTDINDAISDLVGALSPTKPLLYIMPKGTPLGDRFRRLVEQILLRYTKHIYDQYEEKASFSAKDAIFEGATKRGYFFKVVRSEYEKLGTLDDGIRDFILKELSDREGKRGAIFTDDLFTNAAGEAWPPGNLRRKHHVTSLIEDYTKPPSKEEVKE